MAAQQEDVTHQLLLETIAFATSEGTRNAQSLGGWLGRATISRPRVFKGWFAPITPRVPEPRSGEGTAHTSDRLLHFTTPLGY